MLLLLIMLILYSSVECNEDSSSSCGCSGSQGLNRDSVYINNNDDKTFNNIQNDNKVCNSVNNDDTDISSSSSSSSSSTSIPNNNNNNNNNRKLEMTIDDNNMVKIKGGTFWMGTDNPLIKTDGEGPRRLVTVSSFKIDKYEVSNDDYLKFVNNTNYKTESEVFGWSFVFESAVPKHIKKHITQAVLGAEWWLPVNGAYWKEPEGPGTDVFKTNRGNYPAVHISWTDAKEYCKWKGSRLPTEAEWEYAAKGKNSNNTNLFPWGNKLTPKNEFKANIFQGTFPKSNTKDDGYEYLAPIDSFGPQNDYGLYNMIGNAWEWVEDWYTYHHNTDHTINPKGPDIGRDKVKKGGSFLCHRSFCYRYRNNARYATTPDSATLNSGLRCAKSIDNYNDIDNDDDNNNNID